MDKPEQNNSREFQEPRLYPEDQERVLRVTTTGQNAIERKPFRVWKLLMWIGITIIVLGQLSIIIADKALDMKQRQSSSEFQLEREQE